MSSSIRGASDGVRKGLRERDQSTANGTRVRVLQCWLSGRESIDDNILKIQPAAFLSHRHVIITNELLL